MRRWKLYSTIIILTFSSAFNGSISVANAEPPNLGIYQLVILPIVSSTNDPGVTPENTASIVNAVAKNYLTVSRGKISFTLKEILPVVHSEIRIEGVRDVEALAQGLGIKLVADPGYAGIILVGSSGPGHSGNAETPGQYVSIMGEWGRATAYVLQHELGHALGLGHANTATCTVDVKGMTCDSSEYADTTDIMGNYSPSYDGTALRFSAFNLYRLGILGPKERVEVTDSGQFSLAPVYSVDDQKTKILTLPIYNRDGYAIDYRPPTGVDSVLKEVGRHYVGVIKPSYGVQIRLVSQQAGSDGSALPVLTPPRHADSTELIVGKDAPIQGLQPGESLTLSDGSTVSAISEDPILGAEVAITRPKDTTSPGVDLPTFSWATNGIVLPRDNPGVRKLGAGLDYNWPSIFANMMGIKDDRKIADLKLEVDGRIVDTKAVQTGQFPGVDLTYTPKSVGKFKIRVIITDASGNTNTYSSTLTSHLYAIPKPKLISIRRGKSPSSSIVEVIAPIKGVSYQITDLSTGSLLNTTSVGRVTIFEIGNLKNHQKFRMKLLGTDSFGNTDGGSRFEGSRLVVQI